MDHVIKGHFYKGIIGKMVIFHNSFVKLHGEKSEPQHDCVLSKS